MIPIGYLKPERRRHVEPNRPANIICQQFKVSILIGHKHALEDFCLCRLFGENGPAHSDAKNIHVPGHP